MPKITEMYAFVAQDEGPDDEGIVGMELGGGWMPFVGADMGRVESLKEKARILSKAIGKKIYVVHFTNREDLGEI